MNDNPERETCKMTETNTSSARFSFLDKRLFRFLFLLTGGILTALTLILTELWLLQWFTLIPVGLVVLRLAENTRLRLRTYYGYGLVFFWGYYAVVLHWFVSMYPLSFTGLSKGAALFVVLAGVFGLSLLQALISGLAFLIYGVTSRNRFLSKYRFLRPFLFAGCWTVFEWLQTFGWWGVPWGRLALGQIDSLVMVQPARLLGSYFVSFLLLAVNLCLAYALLYRSLRKTAAVTAALILLSNLLLGSVLFLTDKDTGETVRVAAIQGNISNKWEPGSLKSSLEVYRKYTLLASKEGAKIVLWSETALPYDLTTSKSIMKDVKAIAAEADVILLVGAFRSEKKPYTERLEYNSLFAISPDGTVNETVYDKQHLVPFGEFVPLRGIIMTLFPPLADVGMLDNDLTSGEAGKNIVTEYGTLGGMICFDSIYETVALDAVRNGAEFFCLSSNDAWFLDSAAIYMHHNQARLRAIEVGRYVIRSGNSGITSAISPTGVVLEELEPLTEGYVVSDVHLRTDRTPYSVIGNLFVWILAIVLSLLCASSLYFYTREAVNKRKNG